VTTLQCPRCHGPLDTSGEAATAACHACRGLWIGRVALAEMVAEMRPGEQPTELVLTSRKPTEPALPCPKCERAMAASVLAGVAVDECVTDGVWLDADELGAVLRGSHQAPAEPEPSMFDRFASLFRKK
jgi:Zn-finger nucleic acid-binding protein